MSQNLTCASWQEIARLESLNFILFQFFDIFTGFITLIFAVIAVTVVLKRSIFENSTKGLLILNLFYAVLYQIFYGIEAVGIIYKHFFELTNPCKLLIPESECAPIMKTLLTCTAGMILCQTGLILERAFATFLKNYESKKQLLIGSLITLITLLISGLTGPIVYWDDPLNGAVLGCFVFPKQSATRSTIYFFMVTGITVVNLATSFLLNKYNRKLEFQIRFKLCARFHKREVIESTGTICFLTFNQFIFMFIYSFGISILKTICANISAETYYFWIVWCYTIPLIAMIFPILLIYRIQKINKNRIQNLIGISSTKQSLEEHINQMKIIWE